MKKEENVKRFIKITLLILILIFEIITYIKSKNVQAVSQGSNVSDVQLLARAINGEARGETYEGQVAVGAVILNRVAHSSFPNTIAGVIYQPGAFTAVSDGQINVAIEESSTVVKAARMLWMDGIQQKELYTILIQIRPLINGYGQDH